jgi:hypothetical protein
MKISVDPKVVAVKSILGDIKLQKLGVLMLVVVLVILPNSLQTI